MLVTSGAVALGKQRLRHEILLSQSRKAGPTLRAEPPERDGECGFPTPITGSLRPLPTLPTTHLVCWHVTGDSSLRSPSLCSCWTEWPDGLVWSHVYPVQHLCCPGERLTLQGDGTCEDDSCGIRWLPARLWSQTDRIQSQLQHLLDGRSGESLLAFLCLSFRIEKWGCHQCPLQRVFRRAQWENLLKHLMCLVQHILFSNVSSCCYTCNS